MLLRRALLQRRKSKIGARILGMLRLGRIAAYSLLAIVVYAGIRHYRAVYTTQTAQHSSFIARVENQFLYKADLESLGVLPADAADREALINQYVEEWACKQLLIAACNKDHIGNSILPAEVADSVSAYKKELLAYYFLDMLVKQSLNDNVSIEDITAYYHAYKHNDFVLNHDVFKGVFIVIPKRTVNTNTVKALMLSRRAEDRKKLAAYCKLYAHTASLDMDKWCAWESVLAKLSRTPLGNNDPMGLLKNNKFIYTVDRKYIYFLSIDQYKLADGRVLAPLATVSERIKSIILHKRKLELVKEIKNDLLQKAKKNHTCVIQLHNVQ